MKDVLAERRSVLGEDNRLVARTMVNIATLLSASGRLEEAHAAFADALPRFTRVYGAEHPDTVHSIYAYGVLRFKQHEYADAERLLRQALAIQVRMFPDDHPSVADTRLELGKALAERRQFAQAQTLLERAHEVMQKAYGADATDTREASAALEKLRREMQ
jgi:tetratricopeptide (TPR) repeat protein